MGLFTRRNQSPPPSTAVGPMAPDHRARLVLVRVGPVMPQDAAATTKAVMAASGRSIREAKALVDGVRRGDGEQVITSSDSVAELEEKALGFATVAVVRVDSRP